MTLLETATRLREEGEEQLDTWLESLSDEEKMELFAQTWEATLRILAEMAGGV